MTGDADEFDWLDDLDGGVEERDARTEERRKLRKDIAKLDGIDTLDELDALQDRVASAVAGTKAGIEVFRHAGDLGGLARAEYALEMFSRAMRRIDGRRRRLVRMAVERERTIAKEKRKAKQLALATQLAMEKQTMERNREEDRLRREEIRLEEIRLQAEARAKVAEEKTRRYLADRDRKLLVKTKVIRLIRDRGLLDEGTLQALFREAEEIVDGERDDR